MEIDTAAPIEDQEGWKTQADRVQCGESNAVIGGESHDINGRGADILQVFTQTGRLKVSIVIKAAIAIDLTIHPFAEDAMDRPQIQRRKKVGAMSPLDTVIGPGDLWQAV